MPLARRSSANPGLAQSAGRKPARSSHHSGRRKPHPDHADLGPGDERPACRPRAIVPLLPETSLVPGSLRGPWAYDPVSHALAWAGALDPGITLTLGADLSLSRGITDGASLPLRARLYAGDGITITAEAPIHADAPWLTLVEQVAPTESVPGGTVQYTITVANAGVLSSTAHLTDTLPAGLSLKAGSAWAAQGDLKVNGNTLTWSARRRRAPKR